MIEIKDIYWAAGFIDGEGSVQFTTTNSVKLSVPQNSRELLDRLVSLFGGSVLLPSKSTTVHTWLLCAEKAVGVIMTIYPIMSSKRQEEIRNVLTKWKARPLTFSKHIEVFGKCKKGHDWIEGNITTEKSGHKRCTTCLQIRSRAYSKQYYLDNKSKLKENARLYKLNSQATQV